MTKLHLKTIVWYFCENSSFDIRKKCIPQYLISKLKPQKVDWEKMIFFTILNKSCRLRLFRFFTKLIDMFIPFQKHHDSNLLRWLNSLLLIIRYQYIVQLFQYLISNYYHSIVVLYSAILISFFGWPAIMKKFYKLHTSNVNNINRLYHYMKKC